MLDEQIAAGAIDVERFRLTAGSVEREHELAARAFSQRVFGHHALQFTDECVMPAQQQLDVDAVLQHRQAFLVQAQCFVLQRGRGAAECGPAPQRQRLAQYRRGLLHSSLTDGGVGVGHAALEEEGVDLVTGDAQQVAGLTGLDLGVDVDSRELPPERGHADLDLRPCGRRRGVLPDEVDQLVHADHAVGFEQQSTQDRLLTSRGYLHLLLGADDLDRAEQLENQLLVRG